MGSGSRPSSIAAAEKDLSARSPLTALPTKLPQPSGEAKGHECRFLADFVAKVPEERPGQGNSACRSQLAIMPARIFPSTIEPAGTNGRRDSRAKISFTRNLDIQSILACLADVPSCAHRRRILIAAIGPLVGVLSPSPWADA
jgi:hypothetical protein